jgi:predicted RNase H-like HicB family nuclease
MIYWKGEKLCVGKLLEHPEIVTQGETLEELEENMKDAYLLMVMEEETSCRRRFCSSTPLSRST